ncbi:phage head-tail connector protein [Alkalicoccus luteus]|uniref:Phage head-tail connector protein n=1 Tax=Alkalicoccus luteus TaxID=1237094 RepID=A0A969PQX4_9BACI|nr:phage head-tail connector protein [Alkalicoccus luteus]NJP37920.1 phage head-tail connector protein [Alkalicoccus luteus]
MKERVKRLLQIEDDLQDDLIGEILHIVKSHLLTLMEKESLPKKYEYIVVEIAVRRFNRLGSEGMKQDNVEGHSITFYDLDKDFDPYLTVIEKEIPQQENTKAGGVVWF